MRKAKIVCTTGPATETAEQIQALVDAGMDVARINRSHGAPAEHEAVIRHVRAAAKASGRAVAVLVDLQGPKIRLGRFAEEKVQLDEGDIFTITTEDVPGTKELALLYTSDAADDLLCVDLGGRRIIKKKNK